MGFCLDLYKCKWVNYISMVKKISLPSRIFNKLLIIQADIFLRRNQFRGKKSETNSLIYFELRLIVIKFVIHWFAVLLLRPNNGECYHGDLKPVILTFISYFILTNGVYRQKSFLINYYCIVDWIGKGHILYLEKNKIIFML